MNPIQYNLITCDIAGKDLHFKGIKIDAKQDIKRVTHSGDHKAAGFVTGESTIDFTLTEPKDVELLVHLYDVWTVTQQTFTIKIFGRNTRTGKLDPIAILTDCVFNKIDHNISGKEEWKPSVSGMALGLNRINYQFDPDTGVQKVTKEAITRLDNVSATAKGFLNLGTNLTSTAKRFIS